MPKPALITLNAQPPHTSRLALSVLLAGLAVLGSGCSVLQEDKVDYQTAVRSVALDVPPDLSQLKPTSRFDIPGSTVTKPAAPNVAPNQVGDVRLMRSGDVRWLVVDRPAEALWKPVRDFWQDNGFQLEVEQEQLGILETQWAENRAKLPQDLLRRTLGRLVDGLYSTGERDKYRIRFERTATGGTEISISHRGLVEVYTSAQKDQTVWQSRPSDANLENEFLRRLMLKLGASEEQAKAALNNASPAALARLDTLDGQTVVLVNDGFDSVWRRLALSLDRQGINIEDRNRQQGLYEVSFVPPQTAPAESAGFFARLLAGTATEAAPVKQQIRVQRRSDTVVLSVLNAQGQPDTTPTAQALLQKLADVLK